MMTWTEIESNWGDILAIFRAKLPLGEYIDFDDNGAAITTNRPMAESIVAARTERSYRFQHYLVAAGLLPPTIPPRILERTVGERLSLRGGGHGNTR